MKIVSALLALCRRKGTWFALFVGVTMGTACWWLLPYQQRCSVALAEQPGYRSAVIYSPDFHYGAILQLQRRHGWVKDSHFWDLRDGRSLFSIPFKKDIGRSLYDNLAITQNSEFLVGFTGEKPKFWKIPSGVPWEPETPIGFSGNPNSVLWNQLACDDQGRNLILVWEKSDQCKVLDIITGSELATVPVHREHLLFFPGGILELLDLDGEIPSSKVIVRDLPSGKKRGEVGPFQLIGSPFISNYSLAADCSRVAMSLNDDVTIWDVPTGRHRTLNVKGTWPIISPDGSYLAIPIYQKSQPNLWFDWLHNWLGIAPIEFKTVLYDLRTDTEVASFPGNNTPEFALDGHSLAINDEKTLRIYDFPLRRPWVAIVGYASLATGAVWLFGWMIGRRKKKRRLPRP
jgi:hypothetical protein